MKAMREETARFVHSLIIENAPVVRLIDARYTFLNEELARFYRIPGVKGEEMRRVPLETSRRGGLLGHASVLAATSFPDRTSPVVRGTWILSTLLGTPPPPPPPNVPEIDVDERGREGVRNLRQQLERHRQSARCAGCHSRIDPLGFALLKYESQNFNPKSTADTSGQLPNGEKFEDFTGLKKVLLTTRREQIIRNIVERTLSYALCRKLKLHDRPTVDRIVKTLSESDGTWQDLVREITVSLPFRETAFRE